jgi:predicted RND superfamily exporter protein
MAKSISFGFEKLALAAVARPRLAVALLIAFLAVIVASLPAVRFDQNINRVFLSDSPISEMQREYEEALVPPTRTILGHIGAPEPFSAEDLMRLRDTALDLEFLDGVMAVASPFILRLPPSEDAPSGRPVFGAMIEPDYREDLAAFRALETGLPTYVANDGRAILVSVTIDTDTVSVPEARAQIEAAIQAGLADGMTLQLTGEDIISIAIVDGLTNDLIRLNLVGAVLVALSAMVLLRDFRMTVLIVVPAFCGAASVLALSVWLGYPITMLTNVIPILLLVLGGANCLHLARHLRHGSGSVEETLREIGPASALTAITTSLAFASIMITENTQVLEFAILGTFGTLLAFMISLITFSLMALVLGGRSAKPSRAGTGLARWLTGIGTAHARIVVVVALALLVLAAYGFARTTPWVVLDDNLPRDSEVRAANAAVARDFSGLFQMVVEVDDDWGRTQDLAEALIDVAGPEAVLSGPGLAKWRGLGDSEPSGKDLAALPPLLVDMVRPDETTHRILVSVAEPMANEEALSRYRAVYDAAMSGGADRVFGTPVLMHEEGLSLIAELSRSLVIASLGASLFVALAFRSLRVLPLLLIVNVLPLMLAGASLHVIAAGKLTPTAVLGLTVAFGIAIDDTIHFLGRFNRSREGGNDTGRSLLFATTNAGQSMVLTTLLLTCGLAVTLVSGFEPIRLFGGLIVAILWAALIADLLVLPALLSLRRKNGAK